MSFVSFFDVENKDKILLIKFDGKSVEGTKSTNFFHGGIHQLARYVGNPFTTGSGSKHEPSKTEIMRLEIGEWVSGPSYPFHSP